MMAIDEPHYYHHYGKKHTRSKKKRPPLVIKIEEGTEGALPVYYIKILVQRYRYPEFNIRDDYHRFVATNNFVLASDGSPEVSEKHPSRRGGYLSSENKLFIRGSNICDDHNIVRAYSLSYIEELKEAVKQYNTYVKR